MERYISIKVIMDDLLDHPMLKDLTFERVINYTINFMRIVGVPKMFINKLTTINIKDYRGELPCDFHSMIQVREANKAKRVFRYTTDSFHLANDDALPNKDLTYKIQGQIIFTSIKEDIIEISYNAIPIDCDNYPMIPDNSSFIEALENYIKVKRFTILFDQGKINGQVLQAAQQEYAWTVGQATNSLLMPSIDELESISNMWNTLVPRTNEHKYGYKNTGSKEKFRQQ